ncbi:hypothetical protein CIB48_g4442 [Xylaria polymorpha]|nr:hypothetical protein CIB48_g4442 [Xylaria polymorpha]
MPFPYKTVLITGATSGIGHALAERMIDVGIFVVAVGRNQERLSELQNKHGSDKVAVERLDISNLTILPGWSKKMITTYPTIDCIFLNAGFQHVVDFINPSSIALDRIDSEVATNYLSSIHLITHFLPHLLARRPEPSGIVLVSSSLSIVPMPQVANYCATKAAVHSLAWSLRAQLANNGTSNMRVVEVIPPAVKTELHMRQGRGQMGMELVEYIDDTWEQLTSSKEIPECHPSTSRAYGGNGLAEIEDGKKRVFAATWLR